VEDPGYPEVQRDEKADEAEQAGDYPRTEAAGEDGPDAVGPFALYLHATERNWRQQRNPGVAAM